MKIVVCSPSTKNFIKADEYIIVTSPPNKDILLKENNYDNIIAIGGGAVIDTAKILSKNPIICYPTTAAGSSDTSHSVYWDGEYKKNINCNLPKRVIVKEEYVNKLSKKFAFETKCDLISHCLDSLWSKHKTKESEQYAKKALDMIKNDDSNITLIRAGRFGGKAIEITKTTILHAISYPLTSIYGISHGMALSYLIPIISKFMNTNPPEIVYTKNIGNIDWNLVVDEALKYEKINNTNKQINKNSILNLFK